MANALLERFFFDLSDVSPIRYPILALKMIRVHHIGLEILWLGPSFWLVRQMTQDTGRRKAGFSERAGWERPIDSASR
jgi:hypothetical protein